MSVFTAGIDVTADVAGGIAEKGFLIVEGHDFRPDPACALALEEFGRAWHDMPMDGYLPAGASYRRRRHGRFLVRTAGAELRHTGAPGYFQSATVNHLTGGIVRRFAPLLGEQAGNPFLRALILRNTEIFNVCAPAIPRQWEVEVHLVRVVARPGTPGHPSPEGRHREGFDYIAVHHMGRENVRGGRTDVYDPAGYLLARRTLTTRLDSLYADDSRILHDVTPISPGHDGPTGHRDMLLMSFTAQGG